MPAYRIIVPSYHRSKLFVLLLLISPFFLLAVTSLSVLSQSLSPLPFFVYFSLFLSLFASVSPLPFFVFFLSFIDRFLRRIQQIQYDDDDDEEEDGYDQATTTTRKRMKTTNNSVWYKTMIILLHYICNFKNGHNKLKINKLNNNSNKTNF